RPPQRGRPAPVHSHPRILPWGLLAIRVREVGMWGAMTPPRQSRWWDRRNPMDVMTAVWSAATLLPPVSTGAGAAYQAMFIALRRVVLGRTLTMQAAGEPLAMTVTDVVSLLN